MDDLEDRYARLVATFCADGQAEGLASDAEQLAADARSTRLRVLVTALAAAARARTGGELEVELEAIIAAPVPPVDVTAVGRLEELLPGEGPPVERVDAHRAAIRLEDAAIRPAAERLLRLLRARAREDLELPADEAVALEVVTRPDETWRARSLAVESTTRLVLNAAAAWTGDVLAAVLASEAYPGAHLMRLLRPAAAEWAPSPGSTVDHGLRAVGREVLVADHELAHELRQIGHAVGMAMNGERMLSVRRALDDRAPAIAHAALASGRRDVRDELAALGIDAPAAARLISCWQDPLRRADSVARAVGPRLVSGWLETTGQTAGLQRLLSQRLVPTELRAEIARAN